MLAPLLLLLLSQSPDAGAAPRQLVVWGGGATRADAERSLAAFTTRFGELQGLLELAAGFPVVLESAAVAGLKPGFFVAALGVCASEQAPVFQVLDAWEPSIYSRGVDLPLACPDFSRAKEPGDAEVSFGGLARVKTKHGELTAFALAESVTEGDFERRRWTAWVSLRVTEKLVASKRVTSIGSFSEVKVLEARGKGLRLVERRLDPSCAGMSPTYSEDQVTHTFTAGEGTLSSEEHERHVGDGSCGPLPGAPASQETF